ncbi:MAG: PQQ-dependent sugar dehydrogenase [Ferruginibacter sp.]
MRNIYLFLRLLTILFFINLSDAQAQPKLAYVSLVTGLTNPVDAVFAPGDGRMFIAQQNGLIRIRNGAALTTFLDLSSVLTNPAANEQGLLSIAFHPGYASNGYFFVLYTGTNGAITLARYSRNATDINQADLSSGQVLLTIQKPTPVSSYTNHNGGKIIFGSDGYLYMSTGDGGSGGDPNNNAQNRSSLLGKLLRLDVNDFATSAPFYSIPPSNPYASPVDGFSDEIFAYGLRNPWRWSFDRSNGDIWIADVGQGAWEEINRSTAAEALGGNYGWRCYEGNHTYNTVTGCTGIDTISPVAEYGHNSTTGGYSITGGYVYRGSLFPTLQGYYMATDFVSGHVWIVRPNGAGWQTFFQSTTEGGISAGVAGFAEGPTGEIYAVSRGGGRIDSVVVTSTLPVVISSFTAVARSGYNQLRWTSSSEVNTVRYHIETGTDGVNFSRVGDVPAANAARSYEFNHTTNETGYIYYRLAIENADGSIQYSNIIRVRTGDVKPIKLYPNIVAKGSSVNIELNESAKELVLMSSSGTIIARKNLNGQNGNITLNIPSSLSAGMYIVWVVNNDGADYREKLIVQ